MFTFASCCRWWLSYALYTRIFLHFSMYRWLLIYVPPCIGDTLTWYCSSFPYTSPMILLMFSMTFSCSSFIWFEFELILLNDVWLIGFLFQKNRNVLEIIYQLHYWTSNFVPKSNDQSWGLMASHVHFSYTWSLMIDHFSLQLDIMLNIL